MKRVIPALKERILTLSRDKRGRCEYPFAITLIIVVVFMIVIAIFFPNGIRLPSITVSW